MRRRRYIICAPALSGSAGVRALYVLRDELEAHGHEARMFVFARKARRLASTVKQILKIDEDSRNRDVVVYPETVWGNPLGFRRVVRWFLNRPGLLGGTAHLNSGELSFVWSRRYFPTGPCLRVDVIDRSLFYNAGCVRDTDATFVYKCGRVRETPELAGLTEITMDSPSSRQDLANLLRHTRTLYTHDGDSSLLVEALACGAQVKVITKTGFADYRMLDPLVDRQVVERQLAEVVALTQDMSEGNVCQIGLVVRRFARPVNFVFLCLFAALRRIHPSTWTKKWNGFFSQCVYLHP